jgi:hypothetical protein
MSTSCFGSKETKPSFFKAALPVEVSNMSLMRRYGNKLLEKHLVIGAVGSQEDRALNAVKLFATVVTLIFVDTVLARIFYDDYGQCGGLQEFQCSFHTSSYVFGYAHSSCRWALRDSRCEYNPPDATYIPIVVLTAIVLFTALPLNALVCKAISVAYVYRLSQSRKDQKETKRAFSRGRNYAKVYSAADGAAAGDDTNVSDPNALTQDFESNSKKPYDKMSDEIREWQTTRSKMAVGLRLTVLRRSIDSAFDGRKRAMSVEANDSSDINLSNFDVESRLHMPTMESKRLISKKNSMSPIEQSTSQYSEKDTLALGEKSPDSDMVVPLGEQKDAAKASSAYHNAAGIVREIGGIADSDYKQLVLFHHFIVNTLPFAKRTIASRYLTQSDMYHRQRSGDRSQYKVCMFLLAVYFIAALTCSYLFGMRLGMHSFRVWYIALVLAICQKFIVVDMLTSFFIYIMIPAFIRKDVLLIHRRLRNKGYLIMNRPCINVKFRNSKLQYTNAACTAARRMPEFPFSRLLIQLNDFDIPEIYRPRSVCSKIVFVAVFGPLILGMMLPPFAYDFVVEAVATSGVSIVMLAVFQIKTVRGRFLWLIIGVVILEIIQVVGFFYSRRRRIDSRVANVDDDNDDRSALGSHNEGGSGSASINERDRRHRRRQMSVHIVDATPPPRDALNEVEEEAAVLVGVSVPSSDRQAVQDEEPEDESAERPVPLFAVSDPTSGYYEEEPRQEQKQEQDAARDGFAAEREAVQQAAEEEARLRLEAERAAAAAAALAVERKTARAALVEAQLAVQTLAKESARFAEELEIARQTSRLETIRVAAELKAARAAIRSAAEKEAEREAARVAAEKEEAEREAARVAAEKEEAEREAARLAAEEEAEREAARLAAEKEAEREAARLAAEKEEAEREAARAEHAEQKACCLAAEEAADLEAARIAARMVHEIEEREATARREAAARQASRLMAEEEECDREAARLTADHAFFTNASLPVFIPSTLHVLTAINKDIGRPVFEAPVAFSTPVLKRAETVVSIEEEEEEEEEEEGAFTGSSGVFADLGSFPSGALHGGLGESSAKSSGSLIHLPTMEQKTNYSSLSDTGSFSELDSTAGDDASDSRNNHRRKFKKDRELRTHNRKGTSIDRGSRGIVDKAHRPDGSNCSFEEDGDDVESPNERTSTGPDAMRLLVSPEEGRGEERGRESRRKRHDPLLGHIVLHGNTSTDYDYEEEDDRHVPRIKWRRK